MDIVNSISSFPLSRLSCESRNLLSFLLNAKKVLPSDGPEKLPRDWRGLAHLIQISSEVASGLSDYQDHAKVSKILDIWIQKNDGSAKVGQLFHYLQRIDRHDILDDLLELAKTGKLVDQNSKIERVPHSPSENVSERITFDDLGNQLQYYSAYVLYAKEDQGFVDELIQRMSQNNHKICTEDDILPGFSTQFAPVMELIKERCYKTILILSPDFLSSPANKFFMNFVQALSIQQQIESLLPCVVRPCSSQDMPIQMEFYFKLYYNPNEEKPSYNFWNRLSLALKIPPAIQNTDRLRLHSSSTSVNSAVNITELRQNTSSRNLATSSTQVLALPSIPSCQLETVSLPDTDRSTTKELDSCSLTLSHGKRDKKKNPIKSFVNCIFQGRAKKKAVKLTN